VESLVQLPPGLLTGATTVAPGQLIVGVDGGGTKTLAAAWDPASGEVWLGKSGPSNLDAIGEDVAAESLEAAVHAATRAAGRSSDAVGVAVFGLAGTDTAKVAHLVDERFAYASTFTVNDVVTAWAAGTGCRPGVAVIAGTGSNILGVGRHNEIWRSGGWGHILGDEGSGYWLGLEGIHAGLAHRDATGPPTKLTGAATEHFGAAAIEDVANLVYQQPLTKAEVASFAVVVGQLGHDGDAVAGRILREGGRLLARQAIAVIRRTGLAGSEPFLVAQVGSTWNAGPLFRDTFESLVKEGASGVSFEHVHAPPVHGALLLAGLAAQVWSDEPPAGLADRLEQALEAQPA
jgi:N-acetylglucosamine kinase-like BadF-type ATPase